MPGSAGTGAGDREETGDGVEKDGTATSGAKVERVGEPTTAMGEMSTKESLRWNVPQSGGVHQANEPIVLVTIWGPRYGKIPDLGGKNEGDRRIRERSRRVLR